MQITITMKCYYISTKLKVKKQNQKNNTEKITGEIVEQWELTYIIDGKVRSLTLQRSLPVSCKTKYTSST